MELKPGYKQTEVGVIPEDWKVVRLGDYSNITKLAGFEYTNHFNSYNEGGDIIVLRGTNITNNKLDLSDVKTIPRSTSNRLPRSKLKQNDLVFAYVGTIGPVYLIEENDKYHLGPNTAKITVDNEILPQFALAYFTSWLLKREIVEHTSVGAQPSLSMSKIRNFNIILPATKAEQRSIAAALSDVDVLIASLDNLIAKKRDIKQAAMQQLLTGRTRLPGFSGEWDVVRTDEHASIKTGSKNTQDRLDDGEYPFFVRSQEVEPINSYSYDGEAVLTAGDGVGTGKVFHYVNGRFDVHQRVYRIAEFSDRLDGLYFFYQFSTRFYDRIMSLTAKSSVDSVRMEMIAGMQIPLPSPEEQRDIATVLSDMDGEIATLEARRNKTKLLKQGMMQELLTGRIRLL